MLRFFDWRDVGLVRALGEQSVCLDAETGLTRGHNPLQSVLRAYLMPGGEHLPALVWRAGAAGGNDNGSAACGQLRYRPGCELARVLFIAPQSVMAGEGWLRIAEQLAVQAGKGGAQNLVAEVAEADAEFAALRAAGFAVYARQSLWRLDIGASLHFRGGNTSLRPAVPADVPGVQTLYANVVPRLVQQVEPPPARVERGYVLEKGGEIVAFIDLRTGPRGILIQPLLHPEAYDLSEAVLNSVLQLLAHRERRVVYLCARRYQDWLPEILTRAGFEPLGSQAVMVKRLVALVVPAAQRSPLAIIDGGAATPLTSTHCELLAEGDEQWPERRAESITR